MSSASASLELALAYDAPHREWPKVCAAIAAGAAAAAFVVFLSFQFFTKEPPLSLSLHEEAGQLRIGWSPLAAEGAKLEILDGVQSTTLFVAPPLLDITYVVRSSDVQVRLTTSGPPHRTEVARYVVLDPRVTDLEGEFEAVLGEARELQAVISKRDRWLSALESKARILNSRTAEKSEPPVAKLPATAPQTVTRWWR